jgi:hypothetical protein
MDGWPSSGHPSMPLLKKKIHATPWCNQVNVLQYGKCENTYKYPHQCVSNSSWKFGHVASIHRIHSMTFLTVELQENQANLHKDLSQQDKEDMKVIKLITTGDEMWIYLYHVTTQHQSHNGGQNHPTDWKHNTEYRMWRTHWLLSSIVKLGCIRSLFLDAKQ